MGMEPIILRNSSAEAVIRPDIGRVMSFRRTDGENVLWTAEDPFAYGTPMPIYGGLRVMISPEVLWNQIRQPRRSDPATDGGPWTVTDQSERYVRMQAFSKDLGVTVRWSIRLDEECPELSFDYEIERVEDNPFPVHLWTIAQVPLTDEVFMSCQPHVSEPYRNCIWAPTLSEHVTYFREESYLQFAGSRQVEPLKIGTFGRWLAGVRGSELFVIQVPPVELKAYMEGSNLQAFCFPKKFPFYEMEHTGPRYALRAGESFHVQETWSLGQGAPDELLDLLKVRMRK